MSDSKDEVKVEETQKTETKNEKESEVEKSAGSESEAAEGSNDWATNNFPGFQLFADVFCRVDKHDDGFVTFSEFTDYFQDGHLSKKDIRYLFNLVDEDNSSTIELKELIAYFADGFSPYVECFAAAEHAQLAVNNALFFSAAHYNEQNFYEQHKTRFYLKELARQFQGLATSLDQTVTKLESQTDRHLDEEARAELTASSASASASASASTHTLTESNDTETPLSSSGKQHSDEQSGGSLRRSVRRSRRAGVRSSARPLVISMHDQERGVVAPHSAPGNVGAINTHTAVRSGDSIANSSTQLQLQIERLSGLMDKIEKANVKFEISEEDQSDSVDDETFLIVKRQIEIDDDVDDDDDDTLISFIENAKKYLNDIQASDGFLQSYSKQMVSDPTHFVIYELWRDDESLADHRRSPLARSFNRSLVDQLLRPERVEEIHLPASWWPAIRKL